MAFAALLGLGVLVAAMLLLKWYVGADLRNIKRLLVWIGIGLLALAVVFLALTGRMGAALAALTGLAVWASRILNLIHMGRQFGRFGQKAGGGPREDQSAQSSSAMTEEEALRILGLARGASEEEIKAAHRRLIEQIHPDHGGSDYLAAKVNIAKDFLLKAQRRS